MKPQWSQAPDWANYLAMDKDGRWCWFENEPTAEDGGVEWNNLPNEGRFENVDSYENWKDSLEKRPKEES